MAGKEATLSDYLSLLWRYKFLIVFVLLLFSSIGFVFYKYEVPTYSATSYMIVGKETIGSTYDLGSVQKIGTLTTLARSYPFVYQVTKKLDLTQYPIKKSLVDKLRTGESEETLDLKSLALYYRGNTRVSSKRGSNIVEITVTSQDPKVAADFANAIGSQLIEQAIKEKDSLLRVNIGYIDEQLNSLSKLISENRAVKEQKEASFNYNEVANLQERIDIQKNVLSLFMKEKEYLIASIAMNDNSSDSENDQTRLDYIEGKMSELGSQLEADQATFREADKADFYAVEDLDFAVSTNEGMYQGLMSEKQKIVLASLIDAKNVKFLSRAYVPLGADKMRGIIIILIFAGIGAAFAFGLIQLSEIVSKRFKSADDVEETLGLKVIGNLPKMNKDSVLVDPDKYPKSLLTESYRTLATNVKFATRDKSIKSMIFTSDKPETGKSLTMANLGISMADAGQKVLLVDVDLRRPSIHKLFKLNRKPGLTDLLSGKAKLSSVIEKVKNNLYVISAGSLSYNPQSVIESAAMKKFMKSVSSHYDFVFYDSIPLTSFSDVALLASITDASLLVMDRKESEREAMIDAKERLSDVGANVIGVAINRSRHSYKKYAYYYSKDEDEKGSSKIKEHKKKITHKKVKHHKVHKENSVSKFFKDFFNKHAKHK